MPARAGDIALARDHDAEPRLGLEVVFAGADLAIPARCLVMAPGLLRCLSQIKPGLVVGRPQLERELEISLRLGQAVGLQR